ncbi:MAG: ADP-ribosylglycohydrolase family protein [Dermabacteraceae bacterium]
MRVTWVRPEDLLAHELVQSRHEGLDVASVEQRWSDAGGSLEAPVSGAGDHPAPAPLRALAEDLLAELDGTAVPADAAYPGSFEEILAAAGPVPVDLPREAERARIHGAWTGRGAGCLLGKPVEKIPREGIREILSSQGRFPLDAYFTAEGLDPDVAARWPWNRRSAPTSLVENIDGMPEDDDLNFPVLALHLLESKGADFDLEDVAAVWLEMLPAGRIFTAERCAYRNLLEAVPPEQAATHRNPFREWIGALIRADVFGWTSPGDPVSAARRAYTEAGLTHVRNGVYGAMWAAAMCSAAVVAEDMESVFTAGDAVIPQGSQLAEAVASGRQIARIHPELEDALDALHARWGHLHWVHVLNNAAVIAWALEASAADARGTDAPIDFASAITRSVSAGWDTDSVGATVGSIAGGLLGSDGIDPVWTAPLRDSYRTTLPGHSDLTFSDLTEATIRHTRLLGGEEAAR